MTSNWHRIYPYHSLTFRHIQPRFQENWTKGVDFTEKQQPSRRILASQGIKRNQNPSVLWWFGQPSHGRHLLKPAGLSICSVVWTRFDGSDYQVSENTHWGQPGYLSAVAQSSTLPLMLWTTKQWQTPTEASQAVSLHCLVIWTDFDSSDDWAIADAH